MKNNNNNNNNEDEIKNENDSDSDNDNDNVLFSNCWIDIHTYAYRARWRDGLWQLDYCSYSCHSRYHATNVCIIYLGTFEL